MIAPQSNDPIKYMHIKNAEILNPYLLYTDLSQTLKNKI